MEQQEIQHSGEDLIQYGIMLGLDLEGSDADLAWIAQLGLEAPLPVDWNVYQQADGQIVYVNQQNEMQLEHPLDPYFKALSNREKFFKQTQNQLFQRQIIPEPSVVLNDQCIVKANEIYLDIFRMKQSIYQERNQRVHAIQEELERAKNKRIHQSQQQIKRYLLDQETLVQDKHNQYTKQQYELLKLQHQNQIEQLQQRYQDKLNRKLNEIKNQMNSECNAEQINKQIMEIRINEEKRYHNKLSQINQEYALKMESNTISQQFNLQKKQQQLQIQSYYQDKIDILQNQLQQKKHRNQIKLEQQKQQMKQEKSLQLISLKTQCEQQAKESLISIQQNYENKLHQDKQQLSLLFNQKMDNFSLPQGSNQIELYRNIKKDQLNQFKKQIDKEYEQQIQKIKSTIQNQNEDDDEQYINDYIDKLVEHNDKLKNKLDQLTSQKTTYKPQANMRNDFVTIGDIEQVQQQQYQNQSSNNNDVSQRNLSREFNKIINYSKPPLSRSPTPSRGSSNISRISYPSKNNSPQTHHTPSSSNVSNKLLFLSEGGISDKSFDLVDAFKMKEIKQFVANELFKAQQKSQNLYQEFKQIKQMKEELGSINQQVSYALPDKDKTVSKIKHAENELEVQFNIIRNQLQNVQSRLDILKRMRDNLKKFQDCIMIKQKQNIETDIINDYNYLKAKLKKDNERLKQSLNSSIIELNKTDLSAINSEQNSDYDNIVTKWDKIIKCGMGYDVGVGFNEYAVQMIKKDDLALKAVNRLQEALTDLKNTEKRQSLVSEYRLKLLKRDDNKKQTTITDMINNQYQLLKEIKFQLNKTLTIIKA